MIIENNMLIKVDENAPIIVVPDGVRIIQRNAFTFIKCNKVVLPNSIEEIEPLSFVFCSMREINIPDKAILHHDSFFECPHLQNIVISKNKYCKIKPFMQSFFGYCNPCVNFAEDE